MQIIESLFEILKTLIDAVFGFLSFLFGRKFSKNSKYNDRFLGRIKQWYLINRFRTGFVLNGGQSSISLPLSNTHVVCSAPSGSGKTLLVIAGILKTHENFLVVDLNGDIFKKTAGLKQKQGYEVLTLNLIDFEKSDQYNPFDYCKSKSDIKRLIQQIFNICYFPKNNTDQFWNHGGTKLCTLLAEVMVEHEAPEFRNLKSLQYLVDQFYELDSYFAAKASNNQFERYKAIIQNDSKIVSGWVSSASVALSLFEDEKLQWLTSASTLDFSKLTKKKCCLYIMANESKLEYYNQIISLFITQLLDYFIENKNKRQIKMWLDEFGVLALPQIEANSVLLRKHQISLFLCIQSYNQLVSRFSANSAESLWSGAVATKIFLPPIDFEMSKRLSQQFGRRGIHLDNQKGGYTTDRELLTPTDIMQLKTPLITIKAHKPILLRKMKRYYKSFKLRKLSNIKPPVMPSKKIVPPQLLSIHKPKFFTHEDE